MASIRDRADGSATPRRYVPALIPIRELPAMSASYLIWIAFAVFAFAPEPVAAFFRFLADYLTGGA